MYHTSLIDAPGNFPKEIYKDFLEFRKQIAAQYSSKIILKKE